MTGRGNESGNDDKNEGRSLKGVKAGRSQLYYTPESYGKINHKNHQPGSYAFSFPPDATVSPPSSSESEEESLHHLLDNHEGSASTTQGSHMTPASPSSASPSVTPSTKLPSSSSSSSKPSSPSFPPVYSSSSAVNLLSTHDDSVFSDALMETLDTASSSGTSVDPSRVGVTSSSSKRTGVTDGRKSNASQTRKRGGHEGQGMEDEEAKPGLTTESPVVVTIPRPPTSFDSLNEMLSVTTPSPPAAETKSKASSSKILSSSYGSSNSQSVSTPSSSLSKSEKDSPVNPRFSIPISPSLPLSPFYNTNQIPSKSNHASLAGEKGRGGGGGRDIPRGMTQRRGGERRGSGTSGKNENEHHVQDEVSGNEDVEHEVDKNSRQNQGKDNIRDDEEEQEGHVTQSNNIRKNKGGIRITSPPSSLSPSLSSTRVPWTGIKYHPSSFSSHNQENAFVTSTSDSSNFDQNFTRDPIDWSAILSNYKRSNESFNEESFQDLMNHVASGVSNSPFYSLPLATSSSSTSPVKENSVVVTENDAEQDASHQMGNRNMINLEMSLKRGEEGYALSQVSNPSTMTTVTSYSTPATASSGDAFTPVKRRRRPSKSKLTSSSSTTPTTSTTPAPKTGLTGSTRGPLKTYLDPMIDLEEESSSGEGVSIDPNNNNKNNQHNNNNNNTRGNNIDEEGDDPPKDIYAHIGEDSSEKAYENENNGNNYNGYYESGGRYNFRPSSLQYPSRIFMRPGQTSLSSRNYLRRPYSYTDSSSHSPSSPDYYSSPYSSYPHPGGYYQRYYNRQRYQPDLSSASSSMEMNHAEPGTTSSASSPTETEEPSSDASSSDDKNKVLSSPYYHYYDPSAYYTHSHSQEEADGTSSSPFYLSHRHEGSLSSRPPSGFPSWNGLTGFLLGIIPLSLLVASIVPAFVTVPIASGAASVAAAGRRRRRRSLQGKNPSFFASERSNYLDQILTILEQILDSPPS